MEIRKDKNRFFPVDEDAGVRLVMIPPDVWRKFKWPDYQRSPNQNKINQIAQGLIKGYKPGPVTVYQKNGHLNLVDGGHRVMAYMQNFEKEGIKENILALLYNEGSIDENETFVAENTKLRMNPLNIINANNKSRVCALIRGLKDNVFNHCDSIHTYPVGALTIVKAGIILNSHIEEIIINRAAYLSVAKAIDEMDTLISKDNNSWPNTVRLLQYIIELWGLDGRHLLNFAVLGFAYFIHRNRALFLENGKLIIKSKSSRNFPNRGNKTYEINDKSDFVKLAALKDRWNELGDQLRINASRDPVRIALELNAYFWKHRPKRRKIWDPESTL